MKNKIKGFFLGFLILSAVFCSVFTYFSVGNAKNEGEATEVVSSAALGSSTSYVLRDYGGFVAVYVENDPGVPMIVTDIQVSTLREFDQMLLQTGMNVQTHERLVMILEDLGS